MRPFDPKTYLGEVIAPHADSAELPGLFERYLLDLDDGDDGAIEARMTEVKRYWDKKSTHPKYGTFVFLFAPDPKLPESLLDFGAYGSTMEGPIPQVFPSNLQYVALRPGVSVDTLARMVGRLRPFYTTDVQLSPMPVLNRALLEQGATLAQSAPI